MNRILNIMRLDKMVMGVVRLFATKIVNKPCNEPGAPRDIPGDSIGAPEENSNIPEEPKEVPRVQYTHEFAVLSKSYIRDIDRSYNSYQSFENFFTDKSVPFFIVVPEQDMNDFKVLFDNGIKTKELAKLPIFISEREMLERANEPAEAALSMDGYYVQQIIKLCFGLTGIAKHYMIIDPDGFFIRDFDPAYLYKDGALQYLFHECNHQCRTRLEIDEYNGIDHGDSRLAQFGIKLFDTSKTIKRVLGINDECFRNYVSSPNAFDSNVILELRSKLLDAGVNNFSFAILIAPFEFQWYGEHLYASNRLFPLPYLFHVVDPSVEVLHIGKDFDQKNDKFGIQYQSVDYNNNRDNPRVKPVIIYKESAEAAGSSDEVAAVSYPPIDPA